LFKNLLSEAGLIVVLHDEYFKDPTTSDHKWLKKVGAMGWLMVTGDQRTEGDYLFLDNLKRTKSHVFILCGLNHADPKERAGCIINAYSEMCILSDKNAGPRLWKAAANSPVKPVDFRHIIGKLKRYGRN
jgi:hypothetical protein